MAEFRLLYLLRFLKHTFMEIYTLLRIKTLINVSINHLTFEFQHRLQLRKANKS